MKCVVLSVSFAILAHISKRREEAGKGKRTGILCGLMPVYVHMRLGDLGTRIWAQRAKVVDNVPGVVDHYLSWLKLMLV